MGGFLRPLQICSCRVIGPFIRSKNGSVGPERERRKRRRGDWVGTSRGLSLKELFTALFEFDEKIKNYRKGGARSLLA